MSDHEDATTVSGGAFFFMKLRWYVVVEESDLHFTAM